MFGSSKLRYFAIAILGTALVALPAFAAGTTETLTGRVSDTICGAKHPKGVSPAECVRKCVKKGASYALVVGNKVYTLKTSDKATLEELNRLAWDKARVTGVAEGETISVKSVTAAK